MLVVTAERSVCDKSDGAKYGKKVRIYVGCYGVIPAHTRCTFKVPVHLMLLTSFSIVSSPLSHHTDLFELREHYYDILRTSDGLFSC